MAAALDLDAFFATLDAAAPPPASPAALVGVWHALRGEWDAAHDAVNHGDDDCSWVHAALHREEGDLGNADYWYRRVGRARPAGEHSAEYRAIAAELVGRLGRR